MITSGQGPLLGEHLRCRRSSLASRYPARCITRIVACMQYASGAYMQILKQHQMIPSLRRPANPYDNASRESFLKTLNEASHLYR